ncbi:glycoside hydrolase family 2 TIM barrel-domain containing protein [Pseudoalteromonas sp. NCIMB_1079]|uniref:glycoside hydrolase family 2 TIM barrel-domain containing protein n=1 Tax=Pseudoalteromonas sp. NCIMB 1079 TaxID=3142847 RepID=UPI00339D2E7A
MDVNSSPDINLDWRFHLGDVKQGSDVNLDVTNWQKIQLPHDWSIKDIGSSNSPFDKNSIDQYDTGYTKGGIAWYRKEIELNSQLNTELKDSVAILEFGGIYMNSEVYVNGALVGGQHYGYTSFWIDITNHLKFGQTNTIAVKVNNNHLNSRWYSGSGIYRPVSLSFKPATHIQHWGTFVTTPVITDEFASINVDTSIVSKSIVSKTNVSKTNKKISLTQEVLDQQGNVVAQQRNSNVSLTATSSDSPKNSSNSTNGSVGKTGHVNTTITLPRPTLWSGSSPYLYKLKQTLVVDGVQTDVTETEFGIRQLSFDAKNGFTLNGQPLLLKGLNIHHDNYLLGSVAYKRAEERKVERILAAGFNAVRTAHNPPSVAFLNAADRLGLLVINEIFDAWNYSKFDHKNDYASRFKQDWQQDVSNFIKRDRNHPSVIMWSLGNEIPEQNEALGVNTASMLKAHVLSLDSSREITVGANTAGEKADPYLNVFDVVGYNYQEKNYKSEHKRFPARVMYGSETYSNLAFEYWQYVEDLPYVIGDFVWTGWDYIGEASIGWTGYAPEWKNLAPYPWTLAYTGEIDALGFKRPAAYYRDVLWHTGKNKISAFVQSPNPSLSPEQDPSWYLYWVSPDIHPSWTWPEAKGKNLDVVVYSVFEEVELFINGKSYGRQITSPETKFMTTFTVPYIEGTLKVVGYNAGVAEDQWLLNTAGKPAEIRLVSQRKSLSADGQDIAYVTAELYDAEGHRVYHWDQDVAVEFNVSGTGKLLAVGNANPRSVESFTSNSRQTFRGRVVAVVQSNNRVIGDITVTAKAKGITSNKITFKTRN